MIISKRTKTCQNCGVEFLPYFRSTQRVCGIECSTVVGKIKSVKDAARNERKADKARREALKSRADHAKDAQQAVNAVARERDHLDGCISCDRPASWSGQWHASHFLSVGAHPALRYVLANIHKSCSVCNTWLSGNLRAYRPRLIAKEGLATVEWLEGPHEARKYTVEELKAITAEHRALLRLMVADRERNQEAP